MTTVQANALIAKVRANLLDEDYIHDMTEAEWRQLVAELCDIAAEYVWLREESET